MKKLQILGTGCSKCKALADQTEKAAKAMGLDYALEKVTDIEKIMAFGVMATPALAVDGMVKVAGRVPGLDELKTLLGQIPHSG
ncbi:MAG: TM0996/MTH895 family glutaredoxin-like protein [Elusimicrobia bacterium]|nr:TM0996/MTH895 family glutaredoxin-like protein [Elusimicrobiota bacterium]